MMRTEDCHKSESGLNGVPGRLTSPARTPSRRLRLGWIILVIILLALAACVRVETSCNKSALGRTCGQASSGFRMMLDLGRVELDWTRENASISDRSALAPK